jgi:hypothetical protein
MILLEILARTVTVTDPPKKFTLHAVATRRPHYQCDCEQSERN